MSTNPNSYREPPLAQLVETGQAFGQLHGIAQNSQQHRGPKTEPGGQRCRIGEQTDRLEDWIVSEDLFLDPQALIPQRFSLLQEITDELHIDRGAGKGLRDGDATGCVTGSHVFLLPYWREHSTSLAQRRQGLRRLRILLNLALSHP